MKTTLKNTFAALCCLLPGAAAIANTTQDLLPLKKGFVAATCFSNTSTAQFAQDPNGFVVAVIDGSAPALAAAPFDIAGGSHAWQRFHNELALQNPGVPSSTRIWNARNLGEVFGITTSDDNNPNLYVTASTVYGQFAYPAGNNSCTVYRLNGTDGSITAWNNIPQGSNRAGLGNVCYHRSGNGTALLFVSSLEDGKIYRLDASTGALAGPAFDHGVATGFGADDVAQNFTQLGRRVWGLQVKKDENRLYYGVWNAAAHAIWSVSLDPVTGAFLAGSAVAQIASIPPISGSAMPPSDISFSRTGPGRMIFAERYHSGAGYGGPHNGRAFEYTGASGAWVASPQNKFKVGNYSNGFNSAGGVDIECSGAVWASGDALNFPAPFIYGLTRIPAAGNQADVPAGLNSHCIDLDCVINNVPKTLQGDVALHDPCACLEVSDIKVECPVQAGGPFTASFTLKNTGTNTARYVWYTPCPAASLPAGAVTAQPTPAGPTALPAALPPGASVPLTVQIPAVAGNSTVCFRITLLDEQGEECCTEKICLDTPDCDCFIVKDLSITPRVNSAGKCEWILKKTITNISPFTWYHANFLPPLPPAGPVTFTPATIDLTASPVAPGGTVTLTTVISGALEGQEICFYLSLHNADIIECCSQKCCIILPRCPNLPKPDYCEVTRIAPCCPGNPVAGEIAEIILTICNCGAVDKDYAWSISGLGIVPPCNAELLNSQFSPASGVVFVKAGGCTSVSIHVDCKQMPAGACAAFQACVHDFANPPNQFCCDGIVRKAAQGEVIVKAANGGAGSAAGSAVLNLPATGGGVVGFDFINPGTVPLNVPYVLTVNPSVFHLGSGRDATNVQNGQVSIPAGGTTRVLIPVSADPGLKSGGLGQVFVSFTNPAGIPFSTVASMGLSAAAAPTGAAGFQLRNIRVLHGPVQEVELTLPTVAGKHYRIEQSSSLTTPPMWISSTCTITGSDILTDQSFLGTGEEITCRILCNNREPRLFFRAVQED